MRYKLFVGPKVRGLRLQRGWRLETCAEKIGISVSYLSQIEANQRPVTDRVLMGLMQTFRAPAELFEVDNDQRLISDLREAVAESGTLEDPIPLSELRQVALQAPAFARRFLDLHRANHRLGERLKLTEEAVALDEATAASSLLPMRKSATSSTSRTTTSTRSTMPPRTWPGRSVSRRRGRRTCCSKCTCASGWACACATDSWAT